MHNLLLRLHADDNVLVATREIESGQSIVVDGEVRTVSATVPRYFKVAARDIAKGDKIVKCGMCIGIAVESIAAANLVHTHNMKSDYIASFTGKE